VRPSRVFLLAGQSNMVGRGFPLSLAETPDPRLRVWRDAAWETASDPLGPRDNPKNGIGPGMSFGLRLLTHDPRRDVGIVMCAKGATPISKWQPGRVLYKRSVEQARDAGGRLAGILFLQGEYEAESLDQAPGWATSFRRTFDQLRADFGAVPFVLGQIGTLPPERSPAQQVVRDQQAALAEELPGVALVETIDLPMAPDGVHFTVDAYRTLGNRFADAWLELAARRRRRFNRLLTRG
jgi:hypothetical protein